MQTQIDQEWEIFSKEMLALATAFHKVQTIPYADKTPTQVHAELERINSALTIALQTLLELDLIHEDGQDLEKKPFNYPLAAALGHGRAITSNADGTHKQEISAYPTSTIQAIIELRDAARNYAPLIKSKRGNSSQRKTSSMQAAALARNFVFNYRARFSCMPPISKTGRVVELLNQMLIVCGNTHHDAAVLLKSSIQNDPMREYMPSTRQYLKQGGSNS